MLKELIDKFYLDNQENKQQLHFYISDAGKCPRSIFFKLKQAPQEKADPRILRIYEHGEQLHRHLYNVLYRLKIGMTTEIPIPPQEIVSGRADAILCLNGENYVLDIKSMNSMIFRSLTAPKIENVYQVQLYMHFFEIKKAILLYIDKDRQDIKEFVIDYDSNLVQTLLNGFQNLKGKLENNLVPPVLSDYPGGWQCNYCQFKEVCRLAGRDPLDWNRLKEKIIAENK
ncbi:MAG: PD-(D/E)XK nuclease family protein [Candidatus Pacebacteria bacterium]|nr:PD-(D/E)XK nuclease family protein [Candidatus Paceibacterota bacterium]